MGLIIIIPRCVTCDKPFFLKLIPHFNGLFFNPDVIQSLQDLFSKLIALKAHIRPKVIAHRD